MNKVQLKALGLTDEQADKVIARYGQMILKSRSDDKIQVVKDLNATIADRDKQLIDFAFGDFDFLDEFKMLVD